MTIKAVDLDIAKDLDLAPGLFCVFCALSLFKHVNLCSLYYDEVVPEVNKRFCRNSFCLVLRFLFKVERGTCFKFKGVGSCLYKGLFCSAVISYSFAQVIFSGECSSF